MALQRKIKLECEKQEVYTTDFNSIQITKNIGNVNITEDFYIKIENIIADKEKANCKISFKNNEKIVFEKHFQFQLDLESSDNFIIQGYKYLKTLEEFKNAEDC